MTGTPLFYAVVSACVPLLLTVAVFLYRVVTRDRIDAFSVKEAIDRLPMGLAFYRTDGRVLLSNETMQNFAFEVTKHHMVNAKTFHAFLYEHAGAGQAEQPEPADAFLFHTGGRVLSVRRKELIVDGMPLCQLTAYDTTELYEKEQELKHQVEELRKASVRLTDFRQQVDALAAQEAYLSAKERIHDSLGQVLLSTRYFLTEPQAEIGADELFALWEKTIDELTDTTAAEPESVPELRIVKPLEDAAKALGATLFVKGTYPADDVRLSRLVMACARVCMINAVRHGGATEVTLAFENKSDTAELVFRISDNGHSVTGDFREGGGLKNMRANVETEGGTVGYETAPHFTVTVRVPAAVKKG